MVKYDSNVFERATNLKKESGARGRIPLSPRTCEKGKQLLDNSYCCLDLIDSLQYQSNGRDPSCPFCWFWSISCWIDDGLVLFLLDNFFRLAPEWW